MAIQFNLRGPVYDDATNLKPFIIEDAASDARFVELKLLHRTNDPEISVDKHAVHISRSSKVWAWNSKGNLIDTTFSLYSTHVRILQRGEKESSNENFDGLDNSEIPHYLIIFNEAQLQIMLTQFNGKLVDSRTEEPATGDRTKHDGGGTLFNHKIEWEDGLPDIRIVESYDPVSETTEPRLFYTHNAEREETDRRLRIIRNVEGGAPISNATIAAVLVCQQEVSTAHVRFTRSSNDLLGTLLAGIVKQHNESIDKIVSRVNESLQGSGSLPIRADDLAIDFGATTEAPYSFPYRDGGKHLENLYKGETELRRLVSSFSLDDLHSLLTSNKVDEITAKSIRNTWISLTDSYEARQAEADAIITEPGSGLEPEAETPVEE